MPTSNSLTLTTGYVAELYKKILKDKNLLALQKQCLLLKHLIDNVKNENKKVTFLKQLKDVETVSIFNEKVKTVFHLRTDIEEACEKEGYVTNTELYGRGKRECLPDLKYLKKVTVTVPEMWKRPQKIFLKFYIPIFPIGVTFVQSTTCSLYCLCKLQKLGNVFLNQTIQQKGRTDLFCVSDTTWKVKLRKQSTPGKPIFASVEVFLNVNKKNINYNTWDTYWKTAQKMLKEFNTSLPNLMDDWKDALTPSAMLKKTPGVVSNKLIKKMIGGVKAERIMKFQNDDFGGAF